MLTLGSLAFRFILAISSFWHPLLTMMVIFCSVPSVPANHILLVLLTPVQSIDVFNLFAMTYPRRVNAVSRNAANAIRMKM
ncbi:hypothetical protein V8E55_009669 [Tylopilus felleus]